MTFHFSKAGALISSFILQKVYDARRAIIKPSEPERIY